MQTNIGAEIPKAVYDKKYGYSNTRKKVDGYAGDVLKKPSRYVPSILWKRKWKLSK